MKVRTSSALVLRIVNWREFYKTMEDPKDPLRWQKRYRKLYQKIAKRVQGPKARYAYDRCHLAKRTPPCDRNVTGYSKCKDTRFG